MSAMFVEYVTIFFMMSILSLRTNLYHLTPDHVTSKAVKRKRLILTMHVIPVGIENQPKR